MYVRTWARCCVRIRCAYARAYAKLHDLQAMLGVHVRTCVNSNNPVRCSRPVAGGRPNRMDRRADSYERNPSTERRRCCRCRRCRRRRALLRARCEAARAANPINPKHAGSINARMLPARCCCCRACMLPATCFESALAAVCVCVCVGACVGGAR